MKLDDFFLFSRDFPRFLPWQQVLFEDIVVIVGWELINRVDEECLGNTTRPH